MKHEILVGFLFLNLMVAISSCDDSNADLKHNNIRNPVLNLTQHDSTVLDLAHYNIDNSMGYMEFGPRLKFLSSGKITDIGMMMPDSGTYEMRLWNLADTSIVTTVAISADSGKLVYVPITPVTVQANDRYSVTISSNDYFAYSHINAPNKHLLPQVFDGVVIESYAYSHGKHHPFPVIVITDHLWGIADIGFEPSK